MTGAATIQASSLKKGMNKIVLDVPPELEWIAEKWGAAARAWDYLFIPLVESRAKAKGMNIRMPRSSFYMNASGTYSFTKKTGYQYIQRKYYNKTNRKFVIWVEVP